MAHAGALQRGAHGGREGMVGAAPAVLRAVCDSGASLLGAATRACAPLWPAAVYVCLVPQPDQRLC